MTQENSAVESGAAEQVVTAVYADEKPTMTQKNFEGASSADRCSCCSCWRCMPGP